MRSQSLQLCNQRAGIHATTELAIMQPQSLQHATTELAIMQSKSLQLCNQRACNYATTELAIINIIIYLQQHAMTEFKIFSRISNILMTDICNNESACKHS